MNFLHAPQIVPCTPERHRKIVTCTPESHRKIVTCTPERHRKIVTCTPERHRKKLRHSLNSKEDYESNIIVSGIFLIS